MAKKNPFLSLSWTDDNNHLKVQITGLSPMILDRRAYPEPVQVFWMKKGMQESYRDVVAPREKNGWSNDTCDRRLREKDRLFMAGIVEMEKSPIRNWDDLLRAYAELKGLDHAEVVASVGNVEMDVWIKRSTHKAVVAKMAQYEYERTQATLTDSDDPTAGLE